MFSAANKAKIRAGRAPVIDQQWIEFNKSHAGFKGGKLVHHHDLQGNTAYGIPEKVHKNWSKVLHSRFKGGKISGRGLLMKGLNAMGTALLAFDIMSDDPHSLGSQMELINGNGYLQENKLYYDDDSGTFWEATKANYDYDDDGNLSSVTVSYDYYDGYYQDEETGKYEGFEKLGSKTERYDVKTGETNEIH